MVTVNAQRSRYFGTDAESPNGGTNLQSDFFCQRIKDARTVERLVKRRAPHGPSKAVRQNIKGFAAGYNAYLRKTGRAKLPDPTCRGKAWVRPITTLDIYRRFYQLGLRASSGNFLREIVAAAPPAAGAVGHGRRAADRASSCASGSPTTPCSATSHPLGSNAYGVGSQGTRDGRSVRARQPALPVAGLRALVRAAPDRAGQARRDRRRRCRACRWSTSASTATSRGATPSRPRAASRPTSSSSSPGDPTSYLVDGKAVKMRRRTVSVRTPSGTQRHTFYETRWGPVFDFPVAGADVDDRRTRTRSPTSTRTTSG